MDKPRHECVIGGRFYSPSYHMVSADPKRSDVWKRATGKSGRIWLYQPEGSRVWVDGGKGSRGCGGRDIPFTLDDGSTVTLTGPWCSNADSFFADCGIDVRENFMTWGCIGLGRGYDAQTQRSYIDDLIWFDPEPVKGFFDRVDLLAWEMQQAEPERKLYMYWESAGGSSLGPVQEPYRVRLARKEPYAVAVASGDLWK
jgi:hypothetical protein